MVLAANGKAANGKVAAEMVSPRRERSARSARSEEGEDSEGAPVAAVVDAVRNTCSKERERGRGGEAKRREEKGVCALVGDGFCNGFRIDGCPVHLEGTLTIIKALQTEAPRPMPLGLLLKERIVLLGNQIDDFVADAIISQLLLLDAQDPSKDIRLFINSPGGSLSATMAIYDVVKLVRADASTVALGISASTASIILGGGTKGKRLAMPNTRIMIHQPLGGASGQAIDVEIQAREIMHNKDNVTKIISTCTGRPFEQVQKDIDRDRYMSPIEAVEYGIIDGVIDRDSIIPLIPCQKGAGKPFFVQMQCLKFLFFIIKDLAIF
ncbi:hypothetical protein HYC85_023072 [Camellia sinensis]|uniref:ATP-dependent Clp protease proteolytic subunit n=1 Tax=Camellia sinensis TaxID=4442 RepID=A0A7J7GDH1_CAMSI|nr:hypothetical protein HYC85_023072 [Camellia sinensis]